MAFDDVSITAECAALAQFFLSENEVRSVLACRLGSADQSLGILLLEHTGMPRIWTGEDKVLAQYVASLIATSFDKTRNPASQSSDSVAGRRSSYYDKLVFDQYWEMDAEFRLQNYLPGAANSARDLGQVKGLRLWEMPQIDPANGSWNELQRDVADQRNIDDCIFASVNTAGERIFLELSARPSYAQDGDFLGYFGVVRDITKRVIREQDLKSSENKYLNAARLANVVTWVWDEVEARITYCSPELAEIYGIAPEELMKRTVAQKHNDAPEGPSNGLQYEKNLSWIHPDDRDRYRAVVEGASKAQTGYDVVTRIIRDDGGVRVLHERGEPVFDITGRLIETTGVLLDVTEQEDRKSELELKRAQLENLMDNIPGAIYRVKNDENWTPIYKSAGFDTLFDPELQNSQDGERFSIDYGSIFAESDMKTMNDAVAKAIANGTEFSFEYPVKRRDGSEIWLSERGRPVIAENGEIELEGVLIDVTEKHKVKEALAQAQKMEAIGKLTGGIAHDFNNLLAVTLGNLELLKDDVSNPDHLEFIDKSIAATLRGADLTKNMLLFARQARLEPTRVNLNTVIKDTHSWISRALPENIEIHTSLSSELWEVSVDQSSTESAFLNLILNARDSMPQGGKMTIESRNIERDQDFTDASGELVEQGRYAVLSVTDTGHGIAKDELGKIFEPFYTTKEVGSGSGLGLSMIQGFVKQTGGSVQVHSEPGVGTTFRIYFRALEAGGADLSQPAAQTEAAPEHFGAKVLVAEDEPEVLEIIQRTLQGMGCLVTPAASGDDALRIFQHDCDFDLLVTDIVMPGEHMGTHLAKAARALKPDLPVIFMSGYANEAKAHGNGMRPEDLQLSKPVPRNELVAAVKQALKAVEHRPFREIGDQS
ncbi:PAS domain-containing protein [Pseudophaeobacter leonis]|uniref:PAS domain-containing protein n=1 Tax=Pseudophaeobacter leonis TaxID=1144477 RepID=UPI0009F17E7A|nr:PAS domain-containing protein [Pseudophaeobacter leonis]